MPKVRYVLDGRAWLSIARAAELLGTSAGKVRKLMADGLLEWRQSRANSKTFVVEETAVMSLRATHPRTKLRRSRDPLASRPKPERTRRVRGELWQGHHLRLTLPHEDQTKPKKS